MGIFFFSPYFIFIILASMLEVFDCMRVFGFESRRFSAAVLAHFSYPLLACQGVIAVPQSC